jgi:translation initiation factor eIF-2B subunit delta
VKTNAKHDGKKIQKVEILNLKYDLTPQKYLSMIVCEIGNIPPHSVLIVIKELKND